MSLPATHETGPSTAEEHTENTNATGRGNEDTSITGECTEDTSTMREHSENTSATEEHTEDTSTTERGNEDTSISGEHAEVTNTTGEQTEDNTSAGEHNEDTSTTGRDTEDTSTTGRDTEDTSTAGRHTEDTSTTERHTEDTSTVGRHTEDTSISGGHTEITSTAARDTKDTTTTGRDTEDTSTIGRHTEDQEETRETTLHTLCSEQDPGTEHGNRGQRTGKHGNAGLAAGNSGRDSDTEKPSDKETLRCIEGSMPAGTMNHTTKPGTHIPGYEGYGAIVVDYDIPDGIQESEHPQPGSPYCGCVEHAFLPDNDEGRRVLRLLEEAFDRRLTFQVCEQPGGQALVEWADIPHKTCLRGTRDRGGYPDPDYLATFGTLLREKYGIE